jgi:hypothetical protein
MKPNVNICKKCACERHITWRSKTDLKIKQLTPEQVYKKFDKYIKRYSGLVKCCQAITSDDGYVGGSMIISIDFDQEEKMSPKSNLCPYFTEQVFANESHETSGNILG